MSEGHETDDGGGGGADPRLELIEDYTLKTMKIKSDKWTKVHIVHKISFLLSNIEKFFPGYKIAIYTT